MRKKILIGGGIFIFILVVIVLNFRTGRERKAVEGGVVKVGEIVSEVSVEGTLEAESQVEIGSEVMGKITKMSVEEGDTVRKGDLLCVIDPSTYEARLAQAEARLRVSKSRLAKAGMDLRRSSQLLEEHLISEEEHERLKTEHEASKAQVDVDDFAVKEARESLEKTKIRSPISGEVVSIAREEGETVVMGTIGTPGSVIMTVADRAKMLVKARVDETEIVKVGTGQEAKVEVDALPDTVFAGKVVRIGGMPVRGDVGTEQAVNFPVEVELVTADPRLYPGMSATCRIVVAKRDSTTLVPFTSLGRRKVETEETDVLFVAEGNVAKLRKVKVGVTGEKEAEIEEGVSPGDTILVGPYKTLKELKDGDGVTVEFKERMDRAYRSEGAKEDI